MSDLICRESLLAEIEKRLEEIRVAGLRTDISFEVSGLRRAQEIIRAIPANKIAEAEREFCDTFIACVDSPLFDRKTTLNAGTWLALVALREARAKESHARPAM